MRNNNSNLSAANLSLSFLKKSSALVLFCLMLSSPLQAKNKNSKIQKIPDIRVVVDISGSMKKTDPDNLRRPAIRLLAGLIPEGSRAGIWTFGKEVNMAVKVGAVDDAWRELARQQSKKISSVGLYTNLESVMRKVSFDWKKPDPRYIRNLIILTDGHVDVSEDDRLDKASRRRILKELIPELEKAKVKIHTIALSDDVDERLLSTLSAYTDGLYKKVSSADDLQKLYLQMLEQSVKLDTLPIKDNQFNVDASINDMTLLVFNKDKAHPTEIITPQNNAWNKSSHPEKVKWFSDDGYDLVTIKKPQRGQWKIKSPSDKNNRVVVATNLKLILKELPSSVMLGDTLHIDAHLEEDGKALTDSRLLSKFEFSLKRNSARSSEREYPLRKKESDGFSYSVQLAPSFKLGNNELVIQAKSPTLEREIHHQFTVYSKKDIYSGDEVSVSENNKIVRNIADSNNVLDEHEANDTAATKTLHTLKDTNNDKNMHGTENAQKESAEHPVATNSHENKANQKIAGEEEHKDKNVTPNDKHEEDNNAKENPDEELNWTFIIIVIIVGNVILIGSLVGGYLFIKRRKAKLTEDVEEAGEAENKAEANAKADAKADAEAEAKAKPESKNAKPKSDESKEEEKDA